MAGVWKMVVLRARRKLRRGQVLIVSVVGTPTQGGGEESLQEDFARCAGWAAEAGAHIVEANFSCPNVCTPEGSVFQDPGTSRRLAAALRDALPSTPFFIKCGHFRKRRDLRAFYRAVAPSADAVVLVNGIARRVHRVDGQPAFGEHERVGILGHDIHPLAVDNVREATSYAAGCGMKIGTVAVGGVMEPDDAGDFFGAGADGVVLGGAPMLDPLLAIEAKKRHPEW